MRDQPERFWQFTPADLPDAENQHDKHKDAGADQNDVFADADLIEGFQSGKGIVGNVQDDGWPGCLIMPGNQTEGYADGHGWNTLTYRTVEQAERQS